MTTNTKLGKKNLYINGSAVGENSADPFRRELGRNWINVDIDGTKQLDESFGGATKSTYLTSEYKYKYQTYIDTDAWSHFENKQPNEAIFLPVVNGGTTHNPGTPTGIKYNVMAYGSKNNDKPASNEFKYDTVSTFEKFFVNTDPSWKDDLPAMNTLGYATALHMSELGIEFAQSAEGLLTGSIVFNTPWFVDHTFEVNTPIVERPDITLPSVPSLIAEINPHYNFFHAAYEKVANTALGEVVLPNPYDLEYTKFAIGMGPTISANNWPTLSELYGNNYTSFTTLLGKIPSSLIGTIDPSSPEATVGDSVSYLTHWAHCYPELTLEEKVLIANNGQIKYLEFKDPEPISGEFTPLENASRNYSGWFPMSVEISFDPNHALFKSTTGGDGLFKRIVGKPYTGDNIKTFSFNLSGLQLQAMRKVAQEYYKSVPMYTGIEGGLYDNGTAKNGDLVSANFVRQREHLDGVPMGGDLSFGVLTDNLHLAHTNMTTFLELFQNAMVFDFMGEPDGVITNNEWGWENGPNAIGGLSDIKQFFNASEYERERGLDIDLLGVLVKNIFITYYNENAQHYRTYKEILERTNKVIKNTQLPANSHREFLFFEIIKMRTEDTKIVGRVILCPALGGPEDDPVRFLDSQVKYGTKYSYQVYAYTLVCGTKYRCLGAKEYTFDGIQSQLANVGMSESWDTTDDMIPNAITYMSSADVDDDNSSFFIFDFESRPSWRIYKIPYFGVNPEEKGSFEKPVMVIDNPPISPSVQIVPFVDKSDEILINIQDGYGVLTAKPVKILDDEFYDHFQSDMSDEKVKFKSDDPAKAYRIYRLDKAPESYADFGGPTAVVRELDRKTQGSSVKDKLLTNKKYYYTFKSKDHHDQFSNPSGVIMVEMVDINGTHYPIIEEYLFKAPTFKKRKKKGRKLLYIAPSANNLVINNLHDLKAHPLGFPHAGGLWQPVPSLGAVGTESIYGKKFKIRLTSEQSNKMIDINIDFTHRHADNGVEPLICGDPNQADQSGNPQGSPGVPSDKDHQTLGGSDDGLESYSTMEDNTEEADMEDPQGGGTDEVKETTPPPPSGSGKDEKEKTEEEKKKEEYYHEKSAGKDEEKPLPSPSLPPPAAPPPPPAPPGGPKALPI